MIYKKYEIRHEGDSYLIYHPKTKDLVGGADTEKEAKHIVNKMVEQDVEHESLIVWPIRNKKTGK